MNWILELWTPWNSRLPSQDTTSNTIFRPHLGIPDLRTLTLKYRFLDLELKNVYFRTSTMKCDFLQSRLYFNGIKLGEQKKQSPVTTLVPRSACLGQQWEPQWADGEGPLEFQQCQSGCTSKG